MEYARSHHKWALGYARSYFGWSEERTQGIIGAAGWQLIKLLWEYDKDGFYHRPEHALRQEWFHSSQKRRMPPGHSFYLSAKADSLLFDFGCGTAEPERQDWIDRGRHTILMDLEGPNFKYLRTKYAKQNVTFWASNGRFPRGYNRLQCFDVLEHIEHPMECLEAMWDGLKPGGQAVIWFDSSYPSAGHLKESIEQIPAYHRWLKQHTKVFWAGIFDWIEKPRRWWQIAFCS